MPGAVSRSCRRTIPGHVAFNKAIIGFRNPSSLDVFHLHSCLLVKTRGLLFTLSINSTCLVAPTRPRANALPPVTALPDLAHRTLQYSHSSSLTLKQTRLYAIANCEILQTFSRKNETRSCKPATLKQPEYATVAHPYS
jgi:hypothetical protein